MLTTMTCVPLAAIFLYTTSVPRSYPPLLPMQIISGTIGGAVLVALGYSLLNALIAHVKLRHTLLIGFGVLLLLLSFQLPYRLTYSTSPRFAGWTIPALVAQGVLHTIVVALCIGCFVRPAKSPHWAHGVRPMRNNPHCVSGHTTFGRTPCAPTVMLFDPNQHHRRSVRREGHDYSSAGCYFLTICAARRGEIFGRIEDGELQINRFGKIVCEEWARIAEMREEIELDDWIVMPDHLHAIIHIIHSRDVLGDAAFGHTPCAGTNTRSVASLVGGFKSAATSRINALRGQPTKVWQRNYWEHIVRDERDLENHRRYISENPTRWQTKRDYPA